MNRPLNFNAAQIREEILAKLARLREHQNRYSLSSAQIDRLEDLEYDARCIEPPITEREIREARLALPR